MSHFAHAKASWAGQSPRPNYALRSATHVAQKETVARLVSGLIHEDSSLYLAGGSTLALVAKELSERQRLFIVTNNLQAGLALYDNDSLRVMVAGGMVRSESGSLTGEDTLKVIRRFVLDYAIISASGMHSSASRYDELINCVEHAQNAAPPMCTVRFDSQDAPPDW